MRHSAGKGFAPLYTGHEPGMLLLHQPAFILKINLLAPEGFEPSYVMMKTLCLDHLTIRPIVLPYTAQQ